MRHGVFTAKAQGRDPGGQETPYHEGGSLMAEADNRCLPPQAMRGSRRGVRVGGLAVFCDHWLLVVTDLSPLCQAQSYIHRENVTRAVGKCEREARRMKACH